MADKPKVTVFLNSYNHERFLNEAINSILNQSFQDFDLVIKEDASSDSSWDIIQSYSDPRINAFRNERNRQKEFSECFPDLKGEYIAIHNSDDVWEVDKLEKQVEYLETHPEIGAVFSHAEIIGEKGDFLPKDSFFNRRTFDQPNRTRFEWLNYFFYHGNALCHPSVLIRRECYENCGLYRKGMVQLPDFDMWVRLCLKYDIHVIQEKLVRFRILEDFANASSPSIDNIVRMNFENLQIYRNFLHLSNISELKLTFPEMMKYDVPDYFEPHYIIARIALDKEKDPSCWLFGLQVLFDLINDPQKRGEIKEFYHFDTNTFSRISAEHDVFREKTSQPIEQLLSEIQFYKESKSWKVTKPLRWLARVFNKI